MLVPPFEMHVAKSVEDAISLRAEFGDDASFYCGGTELVLVMKLGLTLISSVLMNCAQFRLTTQGFESARLLPTGKLKTIRSW